MTRIKIKNENGEWETMPIIKGEPGEKGIQGEKGEKGDESYPIGTIVEYDGDTIPSGFELVEDNTISDIETNISDIETNISDIETNISDILNTMQPKSSSLKCRDLGNVNANETTTFALKTNWGFLFLYNEWGNGAIYAYDMKTAGGTIMTIYNIRENSMITVAGESGTRNVKFTSGQISCRAYDIYFQ